MSSLKFIFVFQFFVLVNLLSAEEWKPPLGIPNPGFGITTSHTMYSDPSQTFDFGAGPVAYPSAEDGPYTHYIDVSHASATDSGNSFGSPQTPRKTIPLHLPAGSVVEVHGGPYTKGTFNGNGYIGIFGTGTTENPVFVRGVSNGGEPTLSRNIISFGTYVTIENMNISNSSIKIRSELSPGAADSDHLVFRNLTMTGDGIASGNSSAIGGIGAWSDPAMPTVTNVVVWNNTISGFGDWQPEASENDYIGIAVGGFNATDIWILDNTIFHMGGDSVRVGSNPSSFPFSSRRAYIGRNIMHSNHENALDIKGIFDVVVSENEMHGFTASGSDPGAAIPIHYGCANIWIVANKIWGSEKGISCADAGDVYVIGNAFYDLGDAIKFWTSAEIHIVGNTFVRMANGINNNGNSPQPHPIINNVFTGLTDKTNGYHIKLGSAAASQSEMKNNLIYEADGTFKVYWGTDYSTLTAFQAGTAKGQDCLSTNPEFVDSTASNFLLKAESPARETGTSLSYYTGLFEERFSTTIEKDIVGTIRPFYQQWDIGAFEFSDNSGEVPPSPPTNLRVVPEE